MTTTPTLIFADEMRARISGAGEGVLWLHGYTMHSGLWQTLWDLLPGWLHMGVDWPGHGLTPPALYPASLPLLARKIGEAALNHNAHHIVGLSFGSTLALQIAAEFPSSFSSLILGAAGLTGGPEEPEAKGHYREVIKLYRSRGRGLWLAEAWMKGPPDIFTTASANPHLWKELVDAVSWHSWSELDDGFMEKLTRWRQVDHLEQISAVTSAVLLIVGDEEMPSFSKMAKLIHDTVPNAQLTHIQHSGHLCLLESPVQAAHLINGHLHANRNRSQ
jgi:pimeloyl-ACP methyl ester carboxylesterase